MSKKKKQHKPKKDSVTDVAHIEQLVDRCLNAEYRVPWYIPDDTESFPWAEIVDAFEAGFNLALDAVLKALRGDGGERLQQILDKKVINIRPSDQEEYQAKVHDGLRPTYFSARIEAEDFVNKVAAACADTAAPYDCPN